MSQPDLSRETYFEQTVKYKAAPLQLQTSTTKPYMPQQVTCEVLGDEGLVLPGQCDVALQHLGLHGPGGLAQGGVQRVGLLHRVHPQHVLRQFLVLRSISGFDYLLQGEMAGPHISESSLCMIDTLGSG